ncbi:3-keto-5-aminohexanoate cleavage protein [Neorhizobium alkalisoli]|uniref:Uncharacterized protein (DUF849 family) n=1 Tax=Neorhizobium alkalisoli TaxID=528178 RepID=A0A561R8Y2_9HYPH|nr:3-keto-5-aminohexanoate cleavage protein [Neorhizobium alkalisoli]TWF59085.1 uncharacterized protein (DUF849 family) [Neorhizobium alkalisoli]
MFFEPGKLTSPRPVSIAVAPNGGRRTKADHPALPMTAKELAHVASLSLDAGASMIHVHARDGQGRHVLDADAYRDIIRAIEDAVGDRLVIQITSESLGIYDPSEQMRVVREVKPEAVSLALRELLPSKESEKEFAAFLLWLRKEKIAPQFILYTPAEALWLADLQTRGVVPFERLSALYVLGRYTVGQTSTPADLLPFLDGAMPRFPHWTTCAFGRNEAACVTAGALLGGHIRVGFENNLSMHDGRTASGNDELVGFVRDNLLQYGYTAATADELRSEMA